MFEGLDAAIQQVCSQVDSLSLISAQLSLAGHAQEAHEAGMAMVHLSDRFGLDQCYNTVLAADGHEWDKVWLQVYGQTSRDELLASRPLVWAAPKGTTHA